MPAASHPIPSPDRNHAPKRVTSTTRRTLRVSVFFSNGTVDVVCSLSINLCDACFNVFANLPLDRSTSSLVFVNVYYFVYYRSSSISIQYFVFNIVTYSSSMPLVLEVVKSAENSKKCFPVLVRRSKFSSARRVRPSRPTSAHLYR